MQLYQYVPSLNVYQIQQKKIFPINLMGTKYYIVEQVLVAKLLKFISTNFGI
jgi:hypothetical protein